MRTNPKQKRGTAFTSVSTPNKVSIPEPTKPNNTLTPNRATYLAELFAEKAKVYTGDIELPHDVISSTCKELRKAKVTIHELTQLDERPYAVIPHDLATRSHWFMRRFRSSGGWNTFA
jgi:hypothetical protein